MINPESLTAYILTGEFGLLTMAPMYLLGILFPLVFLFHIAQNTFTASGLLAYLSFRMEKPLSKMGLSPQSILPVLFGFSCTTAALAALSSLENKRERLIASAILCITIPCSAQNVILAYFFLILNFKYILLYITFILATFLALVKVLNLLLPACDAAPSCVLPPVIRLPDFKEMFKSSLKYSFIFVKGNAFPFLFGSLMVSFLAWFNCFSRLCAIFSPFTQGFLHLPNEASGLFILSMIKRDLGAAGLLSIVHNNSFTQGEITVCLIILTLFVPCFASVVVLFKQEKPPLAISIWLGSFIISMSVGKLASLVLL